MPIIIIFRSLYDNSESLMSPFLLPYFSLQYESHFFSFFAFLVIFDYILGIVLIKLVEAREGSFLWSLIFLKVSLCPKLFKDLKKKHGFFSYLLLLRQTEGFANPSSSLSGVALQNRFIFERMLKFFPVSNSMCYIHKGQMLMIEQGHIDLFLYLIIQLKWRKEQICYVCTFCTSTVE